MTGYTVVKSENTVGLEKLVMDLIKLGWQPVGGLSIVPGAIHGTREIRTQFYQAMVRFND